MFHKFQLKNGMKVLLVESRKSPVVSVQMWVNTGSADEKKNEEGISHFIEHLVFKGTEKFGVGQIAATVEGSGGELNAYTSFDQTVFYVTISKEFATTGLDIISQMMGSPRFDSQEIDNEREVVIEEIKRGHDSPQRQASRLLFETVYRKHPYGEPVIGYDGVIRKVSRKKIQHYFNTRYVPRLMTLVVVGDFDKKAMKKDVEGYFASFKAFKPEARPRKKEPVQKSPRIQVGPSKFEESILYMAWPSPSAKHKDIPALDVLASIFGQGDSSRLNRRLRLEKAIVNSVGVSAFSPKDIGFFAISATLNPKNLDECLDILGEELAVICSESIGQEELERALVNFNSESFYSVETVDGMARRFGTYEHLFGDYKKFSDYLRAVNRLKPQDLLRVARKYLLKQKITVTLLSSMDKKDQEASVKNFVKKLKMPAVVRPKKSGAKTQKSLSRALAKYKAPARKTPSEVISHKTSGGVEILVRPNHDTAVVSLRLAGLGGLRREPIDQTGLTELLSRVWGTATESRGEREINEQIEDHASSLGAFAGRNSIGLSMTTLSPFYPEMQNLFFEVLRKPVFRAEIVEREKGMMIEQIKNRKDNPAQKAILQFMKELFGAHPYSRDALGNEKTVSEINPGQVKQTWSETVVQKNLVFSIAGDIDPDEAIKNIEQGLKGLPAGEKFTKTFIPPSIDDAKQVFEESRKEQTHLVYGFPGLTFKDSRRHALQVLTSVLAGQGGRLFIELRDKASLAYSVAPLHMEGIDAGYFGAYIGCSPDKGEVALRMMKEEFRKLTENLVSTQELQRAQRYLIGRHDIELQRNSALSSALLFDALYGLPVEETFQFAERINSVTPQNLRDVAQEIFSQTAVISAVGPKVPWSKSGSSGKSVAADLAST